MTIILTALLAMLPPEVEIAAVATLRGVPVNEAWAIHDTESGNVPEPLPNGGPLRNRDNVVSQGNVGRFQVNCPTWKRLTGNTTCEPLTNRHVNILAGVTIMARWRAKCRTGKPPCHRPRSTHWSCHYNQGYSCTGHGVRYAGRVVEKMRRKPR